MEEEEGGKDQTKGRGGRGGDAFSTGSSWECMGSSGYIRGGRGKRDWEGRGGEGRGKDQAKGRGGRRCVAFSTGCRWECVGSSGCRGGEKV